MRESQTPIIQLSGCRKLKGGAGIILKIYHIGVKFSRLTRAWFLTGVSPNRRLMPLQTRFFGYRERSTTGNPRPLGKSLNSLPGRLRSGSWQAVQRLPGQLPGQRVFKSWRSCQLESTLGDSGFARQFPVLFCPVSTVVS